MQYLKSKMKVGAKVRGRNNDRIGVITEIISPRVVVVRWISTGLEEMNRIDNLSTLPPKPPM